MTNIQNYTDGDGNWIVEDSLKQLQKNNNRSISAMFRKFRKNKHFSIFGDHTILTGILTALKQLNIERSQKSFLYACQQSTEFLELTGVDKKWWSGSLKDIALVVDPQPKFGLEALSNKEDVPFYLSGIKKGTDDTMPFRSGLSVGGKKHDSRKLN